MERRSGFAGCGEARNIHRTTGISSLPGTRKKRSGLGGRFFRKTLIEKILLVEELEEELEEEFEEIG